MEISYNLKSAVLSVCFLNGNIMSEDVQTDLRLTSSMSSAAQKCYRDICMALKGHDSGLGIPRSRVRSKKCHRHHREGREQLSVHLTGGT